MECFSLLKACTGFFVCDGRIFDRGGYISEFDINVSIQSLHRLIVLH